MIDAVGSHSQLHDSIARAQAGTEHVYIHVPFCRSRCHYCDFYFVLEKHGNASQYLTALHRELTDRIALLPNPVPVKTLYFGGGTPSLLAPQAIQSIITHFKDALGFVDDAEITLEINPEDVTPERVKGYLSAGINRFSVGVQSLDDAVLKTVARRHTANTAINVVHHLADAMHAHGTSPNISVDLMYGLPHQDISSYQQTVNQLITLPIQHISMYGLQLETGTALETLHQRAPLHYPIPDDTAHIACYDWGVDALAANGFERYEVSNFAKAGCHSRHNVAYWQQKNYLALGPAAHGYQYPTRYSVVSDVHAYQGFDTLEDITVNEVVSPLEHIENLLIFGLRTARGVSLSAIESLCDAFTYAALERCIHPFIQDESLQLENDMLTVNPRQLVRLHDILVPFIGFYET